MPADSHALAPRPRRRPGRLLPFLLLALIGWSALAPAQEEPTDPAVWTGSWYNPERTYEGFEFQVLENGSFLIIWYTYPGEGDPESARQSFIIGVGTLDGNVATVTDPIRTSGPVFGPGYDTNDLVEKPWGTLTVEFFDEDNARVDYDGFDGAGSTTVTRLTRLAGPEAAGSLPAGISAAWFDPDTSGQGWFVEILSASQALVYWFTYDALGNQAWNLGIGEIIGRAIVVTEALAGTGSSFGEAFDSDEVTLGLFGAYTLEFTHCDAGRVTWFATDGTQTGTLPIVRLSRVKGLPCDGELPPVPTPAVTLMSNPTDAVLARLQPSDGIGIDLFGVRDGAGMAERVTGALAWSGEDRWRLWFDEVAGSAEIRDGTTGAQFLVRAADGGTEAFAIDAGRATSASRWMSSPLGAPGGAAPAPRTGATTATARVDFCAAEAPAGAVDFIVGDADLPSATPGVPGFAPDSVLYVPGVDVGGGQFTNALPESVAELSGAALESGCRNPGALLAPACDRIAEATHATLNPVCADLAVAGEGSDEARTAAFHQCETARMRQIALCDLVAALDADQDSACPAAATAYREADAGSADVWALASARHAPVETLTTPLPFAAGTLDFGPVEAGGGDVAEVLVSPAGPMAGPEYDVIVDVPCATPGATLQLERAGLAPENCSVDGDHRCRFTIASGSTREHFEITGPDGIRFDHTLLLQPGEQAPLEAPEPLSPEQDAVLANRCDGAPVTWTFEWSTVEGAASYGIDIVNDGTYSGDDGFGAVGLTAAAPSADSVSFDFELDGPFANADTENWTWRVWAVDAQGHASAGPDPVRDFTIETCPVDYTGLYGGDLMASGQVRVPQEDGQSTCTIDTTMDLTAEAEIVAGSGSWIAFEGEQESVASNPSPTAPPEDCEDNSGTYPVERFEIPLTVDGETVTGEGTDDNFKVEVEGSLSEDGLEIVFTLRPLFPFVTGKIESPPTVLPRTD